MDQPDPTTLPPRDPAPAVSGDLARLGWLVAGLGLAWLACEAAAWAGLGVSPLCLAFINLLILPHFPIAFAGTVAFYLCCHPGHRELTAAGAVALGLAAGVKLLDRVGGWETSPAYCLCAGLGLASFVMLAGRSRFGPPADRRHALEVLLTALLVVGSVPLIFFFLLTTVQLHPTTCDALAYAADGTLGTQVTFVLGRCFAAAPALALLSGTVYVTLPLAFMGLVVLHLRTGRAPVEGMLPAFLCVAVVGFALYNLFPLVGPLFAFEGLYPHTVPPAAAVLAGPPVVSDAPRNCMPSLHTAWALLIWWHARPLTRGVRAVAGVYLGFTVLATVGYGAHYVFDLVVAFPSTMACQALCLRLPAPAAWRRWPAVLLGAGLTLLWVGLLRYGLAVLSLSPWLTAPAALLTVAVSVRAERALYRASRAAAEPSRAPLRGVVIRNQVASAAA